MTGARRHWFGLVFISIAVALIIVDSTIVNVAIPSIIDDLAITSTQVQWVQESYTLVFAALLLVLGTLADRYGRRRILLTGVVIFAAASVLAALAQTGDLLIASRLVQGVGGAMVLPTTLSLINATFRGRDRGVAFAIWGSTIGGMVAVGPLLGGWLTTYFSWRWAFGINVPLGILIVLGVLVFVSESRDTGVPRRIDVVGAVLSVLTSASLVFGLIEGRTYGWWFTDTAPTLGEWTWPFTLSIIPVAFLVTVVSGAAFIGWGLRRQRRGRSTLLSFSLFRIPSFRNGNIAALIVSLGEFGISLSLPLWLQNVLEYDALQTGFVLLALAIGSFVASGIAGALGNRVSPLTIVRAGIAAEIVGGGRPRHRHLGGCDLAVDRTVPVRLRHGRGPRHRAAHRRGARRCARRAERPGLRYLQHRPSDRLRARHRRARHRAVHLGRSVAGRQAGRPRRARRHQQPDRRRRRGQRGRGDPGPGGAKCRSGGCGPRGIQRGHPVFRVRGSRFPRDRPGRIAAADRPESANRRAARGGTSAQLKSSWAHEKRPCGMRRPE